MAEHTQEQFDLTGLDVSNTRLEICDDCGSELPLSAFRRHPHRRGGYQFICSHCSTAGVRRSRGVDPEASYMRPTETDVCGICGGVDEERGLFLDHDHASGYFRGWLCHACNTGIGHFNDDPELMRSAIRYLTADV